MLSQCKDAIDILRRDSCETLELKNLNFGENSRRVNQSGAFSGRHVITTWRAEADIRSKHGGQNHCCCMWITRAVHSFMKAAQFFLQLMEQLEPTE